MTTISSIATWRRVLLVAITALIAALAISFSAPPSADAAMDPTVVQPSHKGWVMTRNLPHCMALLPHCMQRGTHPAWRWSGSSWQQTSIAEGTWVYAYPYADRWHWIWTQRTGWLAIESTKLDNGYRCYGARCPVF